MLNYEGWLLLVALDTLQCPDDPMTRCADDPISPRPNGKSSDGGE